MVGSYMDELVNPPLLITPCTPILTVSLFATFAVFATIIRITLVKRVVALVMSFVGTLSCVRLLIKRVRIPLIKRVNTFPPRLIMPLPFTPSMAVLRADIVCVKLFSRYGRNSATRSA